MQLSEMRDYARNVVDIDSNDVSDSTLNHFISEGYNLIIHSEKRWPFLESSTTFSTAADTKDYSLTTVGASESSGNGLREINSLKTNDHVLELIGSDDADIMYPLDTNTTGEPWYWSYWGDTVRLYPTPDAVYTIYVRGYNNAAPFGSGSGTSDAAQPDLPDPFDPVLSLYVIYRCYQQQEDTGMAQQYYVAFLGELSNLAARYNDTPAPQPMILNSRAVSKWASQSYLPPRLRYSWE
jgi:hypothetical protein